MKQTRKTTTSVFKKQDEKGVAIITVLSVLMLMTVMVISFFTMATNELNASRSTAEGLRAISAKDVAINLAIAQIREATTRENTNWVSQPGAIRLYGIRDRTGRAASIYKLYSSSQMIASTLNDIASDRPKNWNQNPERYVDLNRPVINPDPADPENIAKASIHFPIVDPRAFKGEGQRDSIEGFSYDPQGVPGIVAGGAEYLKRLPMPVQWLYILADGSVGYLDNGKQFIGPIQPTAQNPITSRIAFWTDDESCKVNVNTASEGVFWDTPRVDTDEERLYASHQPQTGEYQRYPGHPAQTCLSTVLFPNEGREFGGRLDPKKDKEKFVALWKIAPGIGILGSEGGTVATEVSDKGMEAEPAKYHLYASPEEILFESELSGGKRKIHPQITPEKLEAAKFFLTARSRAPETTVLGFPRMSMWPIAALPARRTPFDQAIAFCSTIGGTRKQPYFFQRDTAYSRHGEFYGTGGGRNETMYEAFKTITGLAVPGFASSFGQKYGEGQFDDRDNIIAETIDYFRGTNLSDPTNKSFQYTQGGSGRDFDKALGHGQIAAICLCEGTDPHRARWSNVALPLPKGFGRMVGLSEFALILIKRAEWERPQDAENPQDMGKQVGEKADLDNTWELGGKMAVGTQLIQMGLLVEGFAPAHGWTSLQPQNTIAIDGGTGNTGKLIPDSFALGGHSLNNYRLNRDGLESDQNNEFPKMSTTDSPTHRAPKGRPKDWIAWGGYGGVRMFKTIICFEPVVVSIDLKQIPFGGSSDRRAPLRVVLFDAVVGNSNVTENVNELIQSYQLNFPPAIFPVPRFNREKGENNFYSFEDRMKAALTLGADKLFNPTQDVVHSLVPASGDYRILASKRVIPSTSFVPHSKYGEMNTMMAHSLTDYKEGDNGVSLLPGGSFDKKFLDLDYADGTAPDYAINEDEFGNDVLRAGQQREPYDPETTGDFDQGVGNAPDGPYINRPDDGDSRGLTGSGDPYFDNNLKFREKAISTFSPNRVIPSPGMLGSLSTGVQTNVPWQTLLFRPMDPKDHFGARELPDHLWMDYFWMPIVQPYVISEPFSTAGKVNMNYQILPFDYIRRATGLHAVMKAEKMLVLPNTASKTYKTGDKGAQWRKYIDIDETLKQWDEKFEEGETFRTATEICDMYLIPEGEKWTNRRAMENFWKKHKLTGDNTKERPYTNLYPRLTVRSNTFKVHVVAQSIVKVKGTDPTTFDSRRDRIGGEYRGSAIIERAISPDDKDLPDYAKVLAERGTPEPLDNFYTFRIVNEKRFAP